MDDLILLISESYRKDAIGNVTVTETATSVWAHLQSVTRAEWADAGQNGLQPQLVAVTPIVNDIAYLRLKNTAILATPSHRHTDAC